MQQTQRKQEFKDVVWEFINETILIIWISKYKYSKLSLRENCPNFDLTQRLLVDL